MAVSAPTDRRFRRAHVSPSRRRRLGVSGRKLAIVSLVVGVAGLLLYRGATALLTTDALTITRITVSGSTGLSNRDVLSRLDGLRGQHMLSADLETWRQRVLESPWVESVAIRRVLPGSVDVAVAERAPIAVGRIGAELYLIDHQGRAIDRFGPDHAMFDLPLVDGLVPRRSRTQPADVDGNRAALVTRFLTALRERPDLAERVSEIDVADPHNAVVILKGDTTLIRVGEDQFVDRLQAYLDVAPALRDQVPQIDYVDLRFGERVYVKPQTSRGASRRVSASGGG
jgi:cell division protein FtsQ